MTTLLKVYVRSDLFEKSRVLLNELENLGYAADEVLKIWTYIFCFMHFKSYYYISSIRIVQSQFLLMKECEDTFDYLKLD